METFTFKPSGVCSREMQFEMDGDIIENVIIVGGCAGNLLGISRMLKGKHIDEVLASFEGVRCGAKTTSCPDQIAKALKEYSKKAV